LAMLSSKESKELCYALLDEHFISIRIGEVEDMYLTAADRATLEKYRRGQSDLLYNEMELDHDLLLFSLFIDFAKRRL
uniref:SAM-dependent methyltransferase n=1 Tax=Toxocara canis TaxID=6265 RepID=A0A183VDX8_TOXCA